MDKIKSITKDTLIPIGLVIFISSGIWVLSQISHQVEVNKENIIKIEEDYKTIPTRSEFSAMQADIKAIKDFLLSEKKN